MSEKLPHLNGERCDFSDYNTFWVQVKSTSKRNVNHDKEDGCMHGDKLYTRKRHLVTYGNVSGETRLRHTHINITVEWSALLRTWEVQGLTPARKSATLNVRND